MLHQIPRAGFLKRVPFLLAALLLGQVAAFAQSDTGTLSGTVKDQNGAIVPGATVTAKNQRTGDERTATTNTDGTFSIPALKASAYTVTTTNTGLGATVKDVEINVGRETSLNIGMKLADLTAATVNIISSEEATVTTGSASMGANVNPREVAGLPVNGRQLSQLYLQAPGSVNSGSGTFGDIRFSGRAVEQNIVRYDGIEGTAIIDASPGNLNGEIPTPFRLQSSLENVQEFRVDSNNYPAEQGTGTGGQINVVTKSGGKDFHGSVFEYFRNDKLDAANFFDNVIGQKSKLRLNQFGGSVGGPIKKDKAFFFFSYEGYRLRGGINSIEAVPGTASRICAPPIGSGTIACNATTAALIPAFRAPGAVALRVGPDLFDTVQLQANNIVNETAAALRIDFRFNQKHTAYFRFFRDQASNLQPDGVTGRKISIRQIPQNGVAALTSVLGTNLLNEFKFGYNGSYSRIVGVAPTVNGIDLSNLSFNISGSVAGFALPGQGSNAGVAVPGGLIRANSAQNGRGQPYTPYSLSFVDNLNWTRGNHALKFGVEVRPIRLYTDRQGGITYTYANINNFLANTAQSVQFLGDLSAPSPFFNNTTGEALAKQSYYIGYAQDEWKIKPNLTLNFGLRYEYYTPLREANNRQILFDIITGQLRDPSQNPLHAAKNNFGPRVALTWSPNPSGKGWFRGGKTVLRGGFGIYFGPGQTEDQIQPIESNRISSTLSNVSFPQDPNVIAAAFISNPNNRQYQPRAYAPEYTIPEKVYQYSVSVQQQLPYKMVLTAAFVGSQGRNLFLRSIANRILPGQTVIADGTTLPTGVGVVNRTNAGGQVIAVNTIREFSLVSGTSSVQNPYAEIDDKTSGGHDNYRALQMSLGRRFNTGLTLNAQYTFSRSFGNTSGSNEARTAANNARAIGDFDYDLGYNNFDVRHTFNLSALYDLPFGKGKKYDFGGIANAILGNWEIGTIMNGRSGLPLEIGIVRPDVVIQCRNAAGCVVPTGAGGATTTMANGFVAQLPGTINAANPLPPGFIAVVNTPSGGASRNVRRPDFISGVNPYLTNDRLVLNPAAFTAPQPGTFGNVPRNALRGPDFKQFDLVFNKRFKFSESKNLEFRTEIFNIFNHTNFDVPGSRLNLALPTVSLSGGLYAFSSTNVAQPGQAYTQSAAGGTFGLLRQTVVRDVGLGTSRQIQFALRFNF
ncbi:MAG TPA: carboxypeptidase regulatory-like domain-containing protein [Pyrinomonadaceae bacterium]|nr:carboxypeptidase regulatory-like domain-containing protein [Pyrinomonadaceae bacterium]